MRIGSNSAALIGVIIIIIIIVIIASCGYGPVRDRKPIDRLQVAVRFRACLVHYVGIVVVLLVQQWIALFLCLFSLWLIECTSGQKLLLHLFVPNKYRHYLIKLLSFSFSLSPSFPHSLFLSIFPLSHSLFHSFSLDFLHFLFHIIY